jgi:hypothetical protein
MLWIVDHQFNLIESVGLTIIFIRVRSRATHDGKTKQLYTKLECAQYCTRSVSENGRNSAKLGEMSAVI